MITNSDIALAIEAADHYLEAQSHMNRIKGELRTRIEVSDPLAQKTARQRQIIDAALLSLASGNTQKTRELLREL